MEKINKQINNNYLKLVFHDKTKIHWNQYKI